MSKNDHGFLIWLIEDERLAGRTSIAERLRMIAQRVEHTSQWRPALGAIAGIHWVHAKDEILKLSMGIKPETPPVTVQERFMRMRLEIDIALMYLDNYFKAPDGDPGREER